MTVKYASRGITCQGRCNHMYIAICWMLLRNIMQV